MNRDPPGMITIIKGYPTGSLQVDKTTEGIRKQGKVVDRLSCCTLSIPVRMNRGKSCRRWVCLDNFPDLTPQITLSVTFRFVVFSQSLPLLNFFSNPRIRRSQIVVAINFKNDKYFKYCTFNTNGKFISRLPTRRRFLPRQHLTSRVFASPAFSPRLFAASLLCTPNPHRFRYPYPHSYFLRSRKSAKWSERNKS